MEKNLNVATAPKTGTFQMCINPQIKEQVESIYARCGMTLTDAVNVFIQQSLNGEGMPFLITQNSQEALREQAVFILMKELKKGEDSVRTEADWIAEDEILSEFGAKL